MHAENNVEGDMLVAAEVPILVADDERTMRTSIAARLKRNGYAVTTVDNGRAALQALENAAAEQHPFQLLVCDIRMPGLSGEDLISRIRESGADIPVLAVTGYSCKELAIRLLRAGCDDLIEKPIDGRLLVERVRELLQRQQERLELQNRFCADMERAKRLTTIGMSAASVMHDLNNCLGAIDGFRSLVQNAVSDPRLQHFCSQMAKSSYRAAHMIRDVMSVACDDRKIQSMLSESVDLSDIAAAVIEQSGIRRRIDLRAEEGCSALGRRERLEMVLWNLIKNADEAMGSENQDPICIDVRRDDSWAVIQVRDSGPGVHDSVRDSIFEPSATYGKSHGNGLGLYASKQTVETHGGTIAFETHAGIGTVFTIRLPLCTTVRNIAGQPAQHALA